MTRGTLIWAQIGRPKKIGTTGPRPFGMEAWLIPQKHATAPRVTLSNLVAVGQTVWAMAQVGVPKNCVTLGPAVLGRGAVIRQNHAFSLTRLIVSMSVILGQKKYEFNYGDLP